MWLLLHPKPVSEKLCLGGFGLFPAIERCEALSLKGQQYHGFQMLQVRPHPHLKGAKVINLSLIFILSFHLQYSTFTECRHTSRFTSHQKQANYRNIEIYRNRPPVTSSRQRAAIRVSNDSKSFIFLFVSNKKTTEKPEFQFICMPITDLFKVLLFSVCCIRLSHSFSY